MADGKGAVPLLIALGGAAALAFGLSRAKAAPKVGGRLTLWTLDIGGTAGSRRPVASGVVWNDGEQDAAYQVRMDVALFVATGELLQAFSVIGAEELLLPAGESSTPISISTQVGTLPGDRVEVQVVLDRLEPAPKERVSVFPDRPFVWIEPSPGAPGTELGDWSLTITRPMK